MTSATANGSGLFDTKFSIASMAVAVISVLVAVLLGWTGYQGNELMVVGTEMDLVTGMAGFMLAMFLAVVTFVAALYMEPGFDH
ncbi:hypothetical protein ACLI4Z_17375 [Natrialbaceae archaeon A-arb3/5]